MSLNCSQNDAQARISGKLPFKASALRGVEELGVYSVYSYDTVLLTVVENDCLFNVRKYSPTTSNHQRIVRSAVQSAGWECEEVYGPDARVRYEEKPSQGWHPNPSKGERTRLVLDGTPTEVTVTALGRPALLGCPWVIFSPSHYRLDGSCRCDDPNDEVCSDPDNGYSWVDGRWQA